VRGQSWLRPFPQLCSGRVPAIASLLSRCPRRPPAAPDIAGAALGACPFAPLVLDPSAAAAAVAAAPARSAWKLALLLGAVRAVWELVELLAAGALPLDMLAFATSLFGRRPVGSGGSGRTDDARGSSDEEDSRGGGAGSGSGSSSSGGELQVEQEGGVTTITVTPSGSQPAPASARPRGGFVRLVQRGGETPDDASASVLQQMLPHGPWEWRAAAAVAGVRFLLMPAVGAAIVLGAASAGLLPRDPAVLMALLLQGTMPPAQSLVSMLELRRPGGGGGVLPGVMARLTLQLYAIAFVPVTLWAPCFASWARAAAAW
jgi:hypothetical protein